MDSRFKVGENVRVKKGFRNIPSFISVGSIPQRYEEQVFKVTHVHQRMNGKYIYNIHGNSYSFTDDWLETVNQSEDDKFKQLLMRGEIFEF